MIESARPILIAFGLKLLGAIAAYIVGRMLIGFASNLVVLALQRQKVEPTVMLRMSRWLRRLPTCGPGSGINAGGGVGLTSSEPLAGSDTMLAFRSVVV